jgi:hypothetical protein
VCSKFKLGYSTCAAEKVAKAGHVLIGERLARKRARFAEGPVHLGQRAED